MPNLVPMRFVFSLAIVLSLLVAPLMAQAAGFCDSADCISFGMDKEANKSKPDSKSSAKVDHCCVHSHAMTDVPLLNTGNIELVSQKLPLLKDAAHHGHDVDGLLRPPQAA